MLGQERPEPGLGSYAQPATLRDLRSLELPAGLDAFDMARFELVGAVEEVVLGLLVSALSLRAVRSASQVSSDSASQTSEKPAQRSGGMASWK